MTSGVDGQVKRGRLCRSDGSRGTLARDMLLFCARCGCGSEEEKNEMDEKDAKERLERAMELQTLQNCEKCNLSYVL